MAAQNPLQVSRWLLMLMGIRSFVYYEHRIPHESAVVVVSNHRSFIDPLVLMDALGHPLRTACHHYMGQVPVMRECAQCLGCFLLAAREQRRANFLRQASALLGTQQWVSVFPEGAQPMVELTHPHKLGKFQRGFAHLLLNASVPNLAVLPVAITSGEETVTQAVPLRFLRFFDPSEVLFDQPGWHPMVIYHRVNISIGHPYWITPKHRQQYQGKQAKAAVANLVEYCHGEIADLLAQGLG